MCMAKDGTNRGGARIGAGQKKQPLADKILEGNPGRRKLMVMEFTDAAELEGESMPPPRDYLAAKQKNGKTTLAVEIYEKTWQWLKERRCVHLIPAQLIEQYAQSVARWIQCEECITEFGFLAKHPTTGNAIPSPYVAMSQSFMKQANNLWYQIYQFLQGFNILAVCQYRAYQLNTVFPSCCFNPTALLFLSPDAPVTHEFPYPSVRRNNLLGVVVISAGFNPPAKKSCCSFGRLLPCNPC
jgi:hypothetical protein